MNIRWFLTIGMTGSGLLVAAQGLGYYLKMHSFWCGRHVSVLIFTELHSHLLAPAARLVAQVLCWHVCSAGLLPSHWLAQRRCCRWQVAHPKAAEAVGVLE